ncbi:MAG: acyl-CoA thioesterase [Phycisphaerae bacterium]
MSDAESKSAGRFELVVRVAREQIDAQRHASNVAVVDWMNQAAIAHSAAVGYDAGAYRALGGMFVVRRHEIDYVRPALVDDALRCVTWIERMDKASAVRRHELWRPADGALIARGVNHWAFVDVGSLRPMRIPAAVIAAFSGGRPGERGG